MESKRKKEESDGEPKEHISKVIARSGMCSRRTAHLWIKEVQFIHVHEIFLNWFFFSCSGISSC